MPEAAYFAEKAIDLAEKIEGCADRAERALVLGKACELYGSGIISAAMFLVLVERPL